MLVSVLAFVANRARSDNDSGANFQNSFVQIKKLGRIETDRNLCFVSLKVFGKVENYFDKKIRECDSCVAKRAFFRFFKNLCCDPLCCVRALTSFFVIEHAWQNYMRLSCARSNSNENSDREGPTLTPHYL